MVYSVTENYSTGLLRWGLGNSEDELRAADRFVAVGFQYVQGLGIGFMLNEILFLVRVSERPTADAWTSLWCR